MTPRLENICATLLLLIPAWISTAAAETFRVGVVPQFETRTIHQVWSPILAELGQRTGHEFVLAAAPTIPEFETELLAGRFDFVYLNPYHMVMANDAKGYEPVARDVGRQLFGVLVAKKGGAITEVGQLDGKVVAFPAPNALGASLQMRQELNDDFGVKIVPRYVKTHDSVYLNVLLGQAAAGGGVQKTLNQQDDRVRNALTVIHRTRPVAPHPVAAHPRVPVELRQQVLDTLLALGQTEEGKDMLARIPMKEVGAATLDDYQPLREMNLERFYVKSE